ncbi:MAG: hypothetical protein IIB17_04700 [Chloroflexi bacterium]|nr:hypothetical protein [Chloroflexota bacterium]
MLLIGIVGAADQGDVAALKQYTRTAFQLIEKHQEEPDVLTCLVGVAMRAITLQALGRGAIKNRSNEDVLNSVPVPIER